MLIVVVGVGVLVVEGKRLLSEDAAAIVELFRRFTEVQRISLHNCNLSDETFIPILEGRLICLMSSSFPLFIVNIYIGTKNLRHVKQVSLQHNQLGSQSVSAIIGRFSTSNRPLESLDLRSNSLSAEDGIALYKAFINPQSGWG